MERMKEGSWEEQKGRPSPDFHLEERKDPVEVLIDRIGWDGALAEIQDNFDKNPDDPEARRRAALVIKLSEERIRSLKERLQH